MSIDHLLNSHWWAAALRQRRDLDVAAHVEARAHQSVDPHAVYAPIPMEAGADAAPVLRCAHGAPDYELTMWEKTWLTARVDDAHVQHLTQRNEAREILAEPAEEHEMRELHSRALDYFGGTHEETRTKFQKLRAEHVRDRAKHSVEDYNMMLDQIDSHVASKTGLIDRHIATVKTEVQEARRAAQKKVDDCERLLSVPYEEHVARELARVQDELRAAAKVP